MAQFEILTYLRHLYTVTLASRETLLLTNGIKRSDSTCTQVSQGQLVSWIGVGECTHPSASVKRTRNQSHFVVWFAIS